MTGVQTCALPILIIYQSLVATCATLVGLFASGEWKGLKREMDEFELGKFILCQYFDLDSYSLADFQYWHSRLDT